VYELATLDDQLVDQLFSSYHTMGFNEVNVDNPGNMYYYVSMKENGTAHKITWGGWDSGEPETLQLYYNNLMALAKKYKIDPKSKTTTVTQ